MSRYPYYLEPRGYTVQLDYEHRVFYLYRLLVFFEWNQLEVSVMICWRSSPGSVGDWVACFPVSDAARASRPAVALRSRSDSGRQAVLLADVTIPGRIGNGVA